MKESLRQFEGKLARLVSGVATGLVLWGGSVQATEDTYENSGIANLPLASGNIDATNFINSGSFFVTNTSYIAPYSPSSVRNYTNQGLMVANFGFKFDTKPVSSGTSLMASNFYNNPISARIFGVERIEITASNIYNRGSLEVADLSFASLVFGGQVFLTGGGGGLMTLRGHNVDLSRSTLKMYGFDSNTFTFFGSPPGIHDVYWGTNGSRFGDSILGGGQYDTPIFRSPLEQAQYLQTAAPPYPYLTGLQQVVIDAGQTTNRMSQIVQFGPTNYVLSVAYVSSVGTNVNASIRFDGLAQPQVQWTNLATNVFSGAVSTNTLYLNDSLLFSSSNYFVTHPPAGLTPPKPTFSPANFSLSYNAGFGAFTDPGTDVNPAIFVGQPLLNLTNGMTASWGVHLDGLVASTDTNSFGASLTNLPGRIEIEASKNLDLTRAKIEAVNFLSIKATNHFAGSGGASINAPYSDIALGSTNGIILFSNLLQSLPRWSGDIFIWSGKVTNNTIVINGQQSEVIYHFLMVKSQLSGETPAYLNSLELQPRGATNGLNHVVITDQANIRGKMLIDAEKLTVELTTTNIFSVLQTNKIGAINNLSYANRWSNNLPKLKYLVNRGLITSVTDLNFRGVRRPPYFTNSFDEPYLAVTNSGSIVAQAMAIQTRSYEQSGTNVAWGGVLSMIADDAFFKGQTRVLVQATNSFISGSFGNLSLSNTTVETAGKLTLAVTNQLNDHFTNGGNLLITRDGFDLTVKPVTGDLLGTTVSNRALAGAEVFNTWAGVDLGLSKAGYSNNVAIGHLVLDGGGDSLFTFRGTGAGKALYVDYLDLQNFSTNYLSSLNVEPGFVLYFAYANVPPSKLDGILDGRVRWVKSYAGVNSSTNVQSSGGIITVNRGLAESSSIDSDGDGLANNVDPVPFDGPVVSASFGNGLPPTVLLSWNGAAETVYTVDVTTNFTGWQVVTNLTTGPDAGPVQLTLPVSTNAPGFYRVRYSP